MDTRSFVKNMSSFPFESVEEIETYGEGAIGSVYYLLVESLVTQRTDLQKRIMDLDHIASHVAKCLALLTVVRGVVHNASHSRCYIPNDLLLKHGVSHQQFLSFSQQKEVSDVCYDLCCAAKRHMDLAYTLLFKIPDKSARTVFLPIVLADLYLARIEKSNFNVFSREMRTKDTNLAFKLWYKSLTIKWLSR